jgi:hypothetical protein
MDFFWGFLIVASWTFVIKTCPMMNELGEKHKFRFM